MLRKILSSKRIRADAPVYVHIGGPTIGIAGICYRSHGIKGKPSFIIEINENELPKPPERNDAQLIQYIDELCSAAMTKRRIQEIERTKKVETQVGALWPHLIKEKL